jgi:hypothetical protein
MGFDRVHVLFVATNLAHQGAANMVASLQQHGFEYTVLALGERFQGFEWRMRVYAEALRKLPPTTLAVCVDAYDAMAVQGPSVLLARYAAHYAGRPIVFGAEPVCGGNCIAVAEAAWRAADWDTIPLRRFVNGGFVAGSPPALAAAYEWGLAHGHKDDQRALGAYVNSVGLGEVTLDARSHLVYNLLRDHVSGAPVVDDEPLPSAGAADLPVFLHVPGIQKVLDARVYNAWARQLLGGQARAVSGNLRNLAVGVAAALGVAVVVALWLRHRRRAAAAGPTRS